MLEIPLSSTSTVGILSSDKNRVVKIVHSSFEMVL
jgi:hypothetical protein